ncbi:DUF302 domain-containing protein [Chachezhania antarctica]|uniref:DUF302 domain-containing protein n=1 Tax=Chachezhania antarctica TaxID=2340860 RepID=UPI001F095432|nr:DUF302 domain-containing protein [Chachezhania antarctica]
MTRLFSTLLLSLALGGPLAAGNMAERPGWKVHPTDMPFATLYQSLKEAIAARKMGLVTQASASDGARMQGIEIPGNRVIGVYRNDYARRMLKASLAAGIEAPIRFYLTENADGTGTLSYKTPSHVFAPYMDEGGEALQALARELDIVFARIAEQARTP